MKGIKKAKVHIKKCIFSNNDFKIYSCSCENYQKVGLESKNLSIKGEILFKEGETVTMDLVHTPSNGYEDSFEVKKVYYRYPSTPSEQWKFLKRSKILETDIYKELEESYNIYGDENIIDDLLSRNYKISDIIEITEDDEYKILHKIRSELGFLKIRIELEDIEEISDLRLRKLSENITDMDLYIKSIKHNPYKLLSYIKNFKIVDKVNEKYNLPNDSIERISAGVKYYVGQTIRATANTYVEKSDAIEDASKKLGLNKKLIENFLENTELAKTSGIYVDNQIVTPLDLYEVESDFKILVESRAKHKNQLTTNENWERVIKEVLKEEGFTITDQQLDFLLSVNDESILLLIGTGGVGKSWSINILTKSLIKINKSFNLVAPTARAAKVIKEYTGMPALTIHKSLAIKVKDEDDDNYYKEDTSDKNKKDMDILIVDESSMLDVEIAYKVMNSIKSSTKVIFVGDDNQLPSVGPGNVLYDLINFYDVKMIRLTEPFRQTAESGIYKLSTAIVGRKVRLENKVANLNIGKDAFVICDNNKHTLYKRAINAYKHYTQVEQYRPEEIMFLIPFNKTKFGIINTNNRLQEIVNPGTFSLKEVEISMPFTEDKKVTYRVNDKVLITRNGIGYTTSPKQFKSATSATQLTAHEIDIVNGDAGVIVDIDSELGVLVEINDELVFLTKALIREHLSLGYAMSIHKSQGSEAKIVILMITDTYDFMVSANMLNTGVTRAREKVFVFTNPESFNKATPKFENQTRKTISQYTNKKV